MTARILAPLFAASLLAGCGNHLEFTDDVDFTLDFVQWLPFLEGSENLLHTPYVRGAPVSIYVRDRSDRGGQLGDVWARSSDPEIFEVLSLQWDPEGDVLQIRGVAAGAGEAWIEIVEDDGSVWDSAPVEVGLPDRIDLLAAGPALVDSPSLPALSAEPKVLEGGTATFLARYYDGDRQLFGNGTLGVTESGSLGAQTEQTWLFENREWVRVQPSALGVQTLDLSVDGELVDSVSIEVVAAESITDVAIYAQDTSFAEVDDIKVLLAQSFDDIGDPVFGVEYTWRINGSVLDGEGDLLRYTFDPGTQVDVTAEFGELEATAVALASGGYVDSSNNLGCAVVGSAPAALWLWLCLPPLVVRRRR